MKPSVFHCLFKLCQLFPPLRQVLQCWKSPARMPMPSRTPNLLTPPDLKIWEQKMKWSWNDMYIYIYNLYNYTYILYVWFFRMFPHFYLGISYDICPENPIFSVTVISSLLLLSTATIAGAQEPWWCHTWLHFRFRSSRGGMDRGDSWMHFSTSRLRIIKFLPILTFTVATGCLMFLHFLIFLRDLGNRRCPCRHSWWCWHGWHGWHCGHGWCLVSLVVLIVWKCLGRVGLIWKGLIGRIRRTHLSLPWCHRHKLLCRWLQLLATWSGLR